VLLVWAGREQERGGRNEIGGDSEKSGGASRGLG